MFNSPPGYLVYGLSVCTDNNQSLKLVAFCLVHTLSYMYITQHSARLVRQHGAKADLCFYGIKSVFQWPSSYCLGFDILTKTMTFVYL